MPQLEEWEIKKYWEIFQGLKPQDNKLSGTKVSPVLKNSQLPQDKLSKIWELSDIDSDGNLDFEEFCIAMRLIFDIVNGSQLDVPAELPGWLIPASKAHLIQANRAVATGNNQYDGGRSSNDDEEDEELLSDDFDWYISPTDKATYETIYNSNSDSYGRVRFQSLEGLYQTLTKVPKESISSAWNLVNPKSFETIDKDQTLVFLHILNQRENGKRVPHGVPASLRATFSKETPSYDLSEPAASTPQISSPASANNKKAFGESYLQKVGRSTTNERGTDFSATEGTDWEEVRLRRELANLEDLLNKTSKESTTTQTNALGISKHEFEQLLKYKEEQLKVKPDKDLTDVKNDIELIEGQVQELEQYYARKQAELQQLDQEIAQLS